MNTVRVLFICYALAVAATAEPQEAPELAAAETEFVSDDFVSTLKFADQLAFDQVRFDQYHWSDLIKAKTRGVVDGQRREGDGSH